LLAKDLLLSDKAGLEYLLTFRISQDHLESFFGKVGSMGAQNNHPNAIQFKAALRRLLAKQSAASSECGNTLDSETNVNGETNSGVFP